MMKRKISLLGSTGSIGTQSLEVARHLGLEVTALAADRSTEKLENQVREFKPAIAVLYDEKAAQDLRVRLADTNTKVLSGMEGLVEAATEENAETVITAVVGTIGLVPTIAAIRAHKRIALANKETLVCAGNLVMAEAKKENVEILPVDSEHSAIFQCRMGNKESKIRRILLTASGGPFRGKTYEELKKVTAADALAHPTWNMGAKITIDSATLMNKGQEYIEAMHLFAVEPSQIEIVVHPQSIVHSMVEFEDNSVIAQLGNPDMRLPIQFALTYPERRESLEKPMDFSELLTLTFQKPDTETFRCLKLAMACAGRKDAACAVMSAANEEAVYRFLRGEIGFCEIYDKVAIAVEKLGGMSADSIEEIIAADTAARELARKV